MDFVAAALQRIANALERIAASLEHLKDAELKVHVNNTVATYDVEDS